MPIVHVEMFEGRSVEQKRELVRGITETVARVCGVSADGIHVLINEMSRENWGRGAVLHADRPRAAKTGSVALGDFVVVAAGDGTDSVAKDKATEPLGRVTSRPVGPTAGLVFSSWSSEDAWRSLGGGKNGEVGEELTLCDRVDLPAGGGLRGVPTLERYMSVSTHDVQPEKLDEYLELRRIAVNPGMARLHGFVSSDILRKRSAPNAFFVVNQWLLKQDADAYTTSPLHEYLKSRVRPLLVSHSGTREFTVQSKTSN
jgi:4-oxalocrotonate tautomerase